MPDDTFISFGQNHEDVVLWRALGHVRHGRYVEIGANDPEIDSVTRAFHDEGWGGLAVEPDPTFAARQRDQRPRSTVVEAAVTSREGDVVLHRFAGTGLSTLADEVRDRHADHGLVSADLTVRGVRLDALLAETGFDQGDVHFALIDVEGAERDVLSTVDLTRWRPWVLVIESTEPRSPRSTHGEWEEEVLAAGYDFCLFDGVSRFYVAHEHADALAHDLSYPACAFDAFVGRETVRLREQTQGLAADVLRWRRAALAVWAEGIASHEVEATRASEVEALRKDLRKARRRAASLIRAQSRDSADGAPEGQTGSLAALRRVGARALRRT